MTLDTLRSGFVTMVGRPNVGKSTLINQILGTKVTIISPRPNTTRRSVRGVLHRPGFQAVFVDTPGLHRPRTALGRRLNEQIGEALDDIDVVVPVLDATASIGPGDRLVLQRAAASSRASTAGRRRPGDLSRLLLVVNKMDKASPAQVLAPTGRSPTHPRRQRRGRRRPDGTALSRSGAERRRCRGRPRSAPAAARLGGPVLPRLGRHRPGAWTLLVAAVLDLSARGPALLPRGDDQRRLGGFLGG